ncbi:hypothetical protein F7Q99_10000 [Streptomyces kaniharaensis]|uniref:Integral membrane protein n=1 Tax=Streptomyces kaniharaensis TaxID=212423 RepID=A0A6N7KM54_9ACTN|nr:DUF6350 family protein [Streptomyces kaniharaensis]MQS12610.1 hypothetical protein [Streptomyces kaniharaensis]
MTQLMGRPILEVSGELGGRPVLSDLLTGVRTALVGLAVVAVPVLGLWVVTPYADDSAAPATRLAGALWLVGHGAPVLRGDAEAPLTMTPLLLGVLAVVQLFRVGARVTARRGLRSRWGGPLAVWAGYCGVAVAVAVHCAGAGLFRTRVLPDVLVVALLAGFATGAGARSADEPRAGAAWPVWERLPGWARPTGCAGAVRRSALASGAGLVAGGGVLVAVAAVSDAVAGGGRGMAVLGRGPTAVVGLVLLAVVLVPNAVVWGAAYALGPGFAVGTGTVVAPGGTVLGPVPEFPLFALLPESGPGGWRLAAMLLPVLAGVVPAVLLGRAAAKDTAKDAGEDAGEDPWHPAATALAVVAAALLAGAGAALLAWLSGGALAGGRMARLGPVPWWTGLAAAGWFVAVVVPGALLVRYRVLSPGRPGAAAFGALSGAVRRLGWLLRARVHALVARLGGRAQAHEPAD